MTLSIRLDDDLEQQLAHAAAQSGLSKSAIIKQSLRDYLGKFTTRKSAYELGIDLFDKGPGSGVGDLSIKHREYLRKKLREKHAR